ncbi:MAG TPA: TRAP transporter small permease [Clostridiaceae bacterium]|nr:TRAP transporter small permease [Clostridiaceae bacterium]
MNKLKKALNTLLGILAGGSLALMTILVTYQVITRYIFQNPATWTEELVSYMFAWSSLLGASYVFGERGHMNIPVVAQKFKPAGQKALGIIGEIILIFFSLVIMIYGGIRITNLTMGQMTSSLGTPVGTFYTVMPVAGVLNILYAIMNIVDIAKDKVDPFPEDA